MIETPKVDVKIMFSIQCSLFKKIIIFIKCSSLNVYFYTKFFNVGFVLVLVF